MDKKAIIFDFDGTLVESGPGLMASFSFALEQMGIKDQTDYQLARLIGPPLTWGFQEYYGMDIKQAQKTIEIFRHHYSTLGMFQTKCYPGISQLLEQGKKKGIVMAIASAKPKYFLDILTKELGIASYFSFVEGPSLEEELENQNGQGCKSRMIFNVLTSLGDIKNVVMVGDTTSDIIGAKDHNLFSIGVSYGYGNKETLEKCEPDRIVHSILELQEVLFGKGIV